MRYKSIWKILILFFTLSSVLPLSSAQMQQEILIKSTGTIQMNQNPEEPPVIPDGIIWAWDGTKSQIDNMNSYGHTTRDDLIFVVDYQGKRAIELRSEDRTDAGGNECPAVRILLPALSSTEEYWTRKLLFIPEQNIYQGSGDWYEGLAWGASAYYLYTDGGNIEPYSCAGLELAGKNELGAYAQYSFTEWDWDNYVYLGFNIPRGQWNEIIEHVIISDNYYTGYVEIWLNGNKVFSDNAITDIRGHLSGVSGPYVEIRNYPCHWCMDQSIYFAEWMIWTE